MKAWKIPKKHKELLEKWQDRVIRLWEEGTALIEKLTGIKPESLSRSGQFSFVPPPGTEMPPYFTRPSEPYGFVSPKRNSKKGKDLLGEWERAGFEPIDSFHLLCFLGIEIKGGGRFSYHLDNINEEPHLIEAEGWNPEEYGYRELNI